jgi:hypothetical protein
MNKYFYTKKAVAEQLGLTLEAVDGLIESGLISTTVLNKRKLVTKAALDQFIKTTLGAE